VNLGEANAVVDRVEPGEREGAPIVHITVRFTDGRIESADVRADLVPEGLAAGDQILLTKAALYNRWEIKKV